MLLGWSVNDLPQGWALTTLAEITDFNPKLQLDDSLEVGFVPMSHAPTNFRDKLRFDPRPWAEVRKAYTHFADGDVIFAKVTPCFENGKAAVVSALPNGSGAGSSEFHVLRPASIDISSTYLLALVKSSSFMREGEAAMTGAVGLRRVPRGFVENFPVALPPASEQARIAQALEGLLAQVDTLKARLDALPALIERFRQSVLSSAISGKLTSTTKNDWRSMRAAEVCSKVQSGGTPKVGFYDSGVPFLKVYNIVKNKIDFDYKPQFVNEESHSHSLSKSKTIPGDVLMNIVGPPLGKIATVPGTHPEWNINQAIALFRPSDRITSEWISISLRGGEALEKVILETRGIAGQVNISLSQCRDFVFEVPPVTEQVIISSKTSQLSIFADQLEARLADARQRVDALTQSILAKAFRGELVPQDPNDEPASVLLERIAAQRAADPKPKRGRAAKATS